MRWLSRTVFADAGASGVSSKGGLTGAEPDCLIVLGMHRSGTSALTGLISHLGVHPGHDLAPAVEGVNPKGFWEVREIVAIHDRILEVLGRAWCDPRPLPPDWWTWPEVASLSAELREVVRREYANAPMWVLKDPRICRLLPIWYPILEQENRVPGFVIPLRHPHAVASSLACRDGFSEEHGLLLWIMHVLQSELDSRTWRRVVVIFDDFIRDPFTQVRNIEDSLGIRIGRGDESRMAAVSFVDASLNHHTSVVSNNAHPVSRMAVALYERICDHGNADSWLKEHAEQLDQLLALAFPWLGLPAALLRSITECEQNGQALIECRQEVIRVKRSLGWRLGAPLRVAARVGRMLVQKNR